VGAGEAVAIFAAGGAAGTINTIVGSGTLLTFPVLLAFGYEPVTANVTNTIGLVPGSVAGAYGYRAELEGQRRRVFWLALASLVGGIVGAVLLLVLPASAFKAIVPVFIAAALVLVVAQPWLTRRLAGRHDHPLHARGVLPLSLFAIGVYGGYFGAAQGILLLAVLGLSLSDPLQRINAMKNILAGLTNAIAGIVFVIAASHVSWGAAGLLAAGSVLGGHLGARVGRRLPPPVLRGAIVAIGTAAILKLVL
jgi:uncharacterized membrane protein YfcA